MAFYVGFRPHTTELKGLAAVAGHASDDLEYFQSAKGETGLAHCEARGWDRHMALPFWFSLSWLFCAQFAGGRNRSSRADRRPFNLVNNAETSPTVQTPARTPLNRFLQNTTRRHRSASIGRSGDEPVIIFAEQDTSSVSHRYAQQFRGPCRHSMTKLKRWLT
jgi:hypothetical protein